MNKVILDGTIYSEFIVKKAISEYSTIAQIHFDITGNDMICEFISSIYDIEKTIKEFENYIIDLTNSIQDFDYDN